MEPTPAARKRRRILDAALEVFLDSGYLGTSTDQLAAAASISKATLYKEFGDKRGVFVALIEHAADGIDDPFAPLVERMHEVPSAAHGIDLLAEQFTRSIMAPGVQKLRRLVMSEAARFPDLGALYWERGFQRVLESVGRCLAVLDGRGLLDVPDPDLAAQHFAGMMLWIPSNQVMFRPDADPADGEQVTRFIMSGAAAFHRAYTPGE